MSSYTLALPPGAHLPDILPLGCSKRRGVALAVLTHYVIRSLQAQAAGKAAPEDEFGVLIPAPVKAKAAPKVKRSAQPVEPQTCVCKVCGAAFTYDRLGAGHLRQYCPACKRERERASNRETAERRRGRQ